MVYNIGGSSHVDGSYHGVARVFFFVVLAVLELKLLHFGGHDGFAVSTTMAYCMELVGSKRLGTVLIELDT